MRSQCQLWGDPHATDDQIATHRAQVTQEYEQYVEALKERYLVWLGRRDSTSSDEEILEHHIGRRFLYIDGLAPDELPTPQQIALASRLIWDFGTEALRLSRVHEVLAFLTAMAADPTLTSAHTAAVTQLLDALRQRLLTPHALGPFTPLGAYYLDALILDSYEQTHQEVKQLYRHHRTTTDRARALHVRYPRIAEDLFLATIEAADRTTNTASRMALFIVAQQYQTQPTTLKDHVLPRAKRTRKRRRA
jgi:hypothetical protein